MTSLFSSLTHGAPRRQVLATATRLLLVVGLGANSLVAQAQTTTAKPLPVVASFSILGDLARQVGGEHVAVTTLVGPDGDAHSYSPSAQDARRLQTARVLVVNGLGFESWLPRLEKASGFKGQEIVASTGVQPRVFEGHGEHGHSHDGEQQHHDDDHDHDHAHEGGHDHDDEHGHGHHHHGPQDPHAWQNVANVMIYVDNIAQGLSQADPAHAADYRARAADYRLKLQALDADIRQQVAQIPAARRQLVTTHDAFGYFGDAYGIRFIGARGLANEAEPSAAGLAALAQQIRQDHIPAVFLENIGDPRLMEQLARETGVTVGGELYSDALSKPGEAGATYLDFMRSNLQQLVKALKTP